MSLNLLAASRGVDIKNSDTLSEVSESGTATSGTESNWGSKEELREFVSKHGLKDITDLHQDRFRVDRKKLEQMLSGDNDALIPAEVFFAKIMEDTDTYITWPNKLKLGAKSKKDPHVRIAGKQENVLAAKERIMTILYTRCNRVTMKMDISYTDHSHIIGKGGLCIKRVMEETQCHVHFPDSNRSNSLEKSNQVSISGDLEGVESARSRVRELIPLIFGFEPPITSQNIDNTCPYVIKIQEQYKVQVMFKTRSKLHATIVLVKGVEWEVDQVKQATLHLMEYMCENLTSQIPVQMSIQISPQHHATVLGKNHSNLKAIMQCTNTKIIFPDAQDQNIPSLKKSNISISGNIHNVYTARQLLMGSLPLLIIFDLPEDTTSLRIKPEDLTEIQSICEVSINIKQKNKQVIKSCVIKGIERHATNIYKARNMVLGINEAPITADIPRSYHIPISSPSSPFPSNNSDILQPSANINNIPVSPLLSPMFTWQYPSPNLIQSPNFVGMIQKPPYLYNLMQPSSTSSGFHSLGSFSTSNVEQQQRESSEFSSGSSSTTLSSSNQRSPRNCTSTQVYKNFGETCSEKSGEQSDSTGYQSMPEKDMERLQLNSYDYEIKRLAGLKAMQARPNPNMYRVPNNAWQGLGLSHTSPAASSKDNSKNRNDDIWRSPRPAYSNDHYYNPTTSGVNMNTSNLLDHNPTPVVNHVTSSAWSDLPTLLNALGLDRYIGLFVQHEVDLATFATFSDTDLKTIGVNAFGSRRKMLLAIAELNKRSNSFSVAPGAERKSSASNSPQSHDGSFKENW